MNVYKIRIQKGDTVVIRAGKHKGKTGKVLTTFPKLNKVTVEGINIAKKHVKPNKEHPQGTILEITRPINVSNVGIYDATTKKPSRIAYKMTDKSKVRVHANTKKEIK